MTQDELKALLHYDPETGVFTWLEDRKGGAKEGDAAGGVTPLGYVRIGVNQGRYMAHRLAWLYMTGAWPVEFIDHVNGVKTDNRWANIRAADKSLNAQNMRAGKRTSGTRLLGVSVHKGRRLGYTANLQIGGKRHFLGSFSSPELAHAAYLDAKRLHHPGCTI